VLFYVIDVADLDAAAEWAAKMPVAEYGSVEIRPGGRVRANVTTAALALERAYRDERAAVLAGSCAGSAAGVTLAEDPLQDAVLAAAVDWDRRALARRPGRAPPPLR
jgi:YCII-related domain